MKRLSVINRGTAGRRVRRLRLFIHAVVGFRLDTLIDGTAGMENFNPIGDANWRGENGAIVADNGKGGYLSRKTPTRTSRSRPSSGRIRPPQRRLIPAPIPTRSPPPMLTR